MGKKMWPMWGHVFPARCWNACPDSYDIQAISYIHMRTLPHRNIPKAAGKRLRVSFFTTLTNNK